MATKYGLVGSSPGQTRCTVRCIHSATSAHVTELFALWRHLSAQQASEALRRPDFVVAVQADKDMQLPKLLELDRAACELMKRSSEIWSMPRLSA